MSNIAWDAAEDEAIATLLHRFGVDAIDVAPGKYFPELANATGEDILRVKNWWLERGIEITGMQALLFDTTGLEYLWSAGSSGRNAATSHRGMPHRCRSGGQEIGLWRTEESRSHWVE